ncbi:MAG: hypothetical protein WDM79_04995 [Terricaulis sp.]
MRVAPSVIALVFALSVLPAAAQDRMQAAGSNFEAAMAQAQADAQRPGDDLLTCDQLQAEMGATMNSQEVQTNTAELGEAAQRQQARAEEARRQQLAMVGTGVVTGIIGSFVPGAGYAQGLAMQAQAAQMQEQSNASMGETEGMIGNMQAMMPQMMRGQRVYELAQAKQCPFIDEAMAEAPPQ